MPATPPMTGSDDRVARAVATVAEAAAVLGIGPPGELGVVRVGTSVLVVANAVGVMFRVDDQVPVGRVQRQVAVASVLERFGVAAIRLAGDHHQPVVFDDPVVTVSAWHLEELTGAVVGPAELGGMARRLHDVDIAVGGQVGVPPFEPFVAITEQLAMAAATGLTAPDDLELLATVTGRLAAAWPAAAADAATTPGVGTGVVHGDLHAGNVLATRRGPVLADLELAGIGSVAYDLVAAVVAVERYGAPASTIADYVAGYGHPIPAAARSGVLRDTYELWLTAWSVANAHVDVTHATEARARLARWHDPSGAAPPWTLL